MREQLRQLHVALRSSIDYINQGGCIHFAYYFSKRLQELGISHKILFTDYFRIDLRYKNFKSVAHVAVYIPEIGFIDGREIFDLFGCRQYRKVTKVSLKKLDTFRQTGSWNDCYDTSQNVKLEKLIQQYIK